MSGVVKEAIKRLLATICLMWLWETRDSKQVDATWMTYWIYPNDLHIADERMKGKRIQIDFNIVDKSGPSY
jgi:hypothetical protein